VLTQHTFETGGIRLRYADSGGDGPPVVLLHGATLNWETFRAMVPALSEGWRVLALNLRGHGGSDWTPGAYRFTDYSEDVAAFLREVANEPAVILAHSFAGYFALHAAANVPERVRGLVLLDPPLFYRRKPLRDTSWFEWFEKVYAAIGNGARTREEIEASLRESFPDEAPATLAARAERLTQVDPEALRTFMEHRHMDGYDLDGVLRSVRCPVLLIQTDPALGSALEDPDAEHALALLLDASLVKLPGVGHMAHSSKPGALLREIERFTRSDG
jgi:pimeloyl-ACP methyl ester carboxylesterase